MMKRLMIFVCLLTAISISAQNDTTISRVVTVERDFQPVIQSAGKINQQPTILQEELQLNPVVYSTYSAPLAVGHNIYPLQVAETKFTTQTPLNGILEGAVGHRNTHLLFGYQLHKKKNDLNLYANHDAYWGKPGLVKDEQSNSTIGLDYTYHFRDLDFYTNIAGNLAHWVYYTPTLRTSYGKICVGPGDGLLWNAQANVGIKSTSNNAFQYRIQTGYVAMGEWDQVDHIINTHIDFKWTNHTHAAGINIQVKNNFYSETVWATDDMNEPFFHLNYIPHNRHALRVEPFYEYSNNNFQLHAGINLDMNIDPFIGTDQWLSKTDNLGFAPSPNIQVAWHTKDNVFHLYANATGSYGTAMRDKELLYNRFSYRNETQYVAPYTPIDATIGFKLRPLKSLLLDIYGGYAWMGHYATIVDIEQVHWMDATAIDYLIAQQEYQQWKVGGALHYHYRDIVELNVHGNYYFFRRTEPIKPVEDTEHHPVAYDRPDWDLKARLDVHIDSKWSIYSDNYFAGSRWANTSEGDKQIKPIISLSIGGQYIINRWLSVYLQLDDYLNRKDEVFYGFQSQGIHFLAGVKWKF
jgi:hypothetical protein